MLDRPLTPALVAKIKDLAKQQGEPPWAVDAVLNGLDEGEGLDPVAAVCQVIHAVHVEVVTRSEKETNITAAASARRIEVPGPITPAARVRSGHLLQAIRPEVEGLRRVLFTSAAPKFPGPPSREDARGWLAALTHAARWIEQQAAQQARRVSRTAFRETTGPLRRAERSAREAAQSIGAEYEVRLIQRHLDYFAPVTAARIAAGASLRSQREAILAQWRAREHPRGPRPRVPAGRLYEVDQDGLIVGSVGVRGPALEVTDAAVLLSREDHSEVPPLWLLERRCRAWAERTGFTVPALVAHVLTGLPPVFRPVRLTLQTGPFPEMTLTDRTGDVTEEVLLRLWRRGRKPLGFYRRKPTSDANRKLVEAVQQRGEPTPFLDPEYWKEVPPLGAGWRAKAERYRRTIIREAGHDPSGRRHRQGGHESRSGV